MVGGAYFALVFFNMGKVPLIPVGDPRRRKEGIPLLEAKFRGNLARRYAKKQLDAPAPVVEFGELVRRVALRIAQRGGRPDR